MMSETERRLETPSPVPLRLVKAPERDALSPKGERAALFQKVGPPSPKGRGWTATALSPAVAGRVRGHLRGEDRLRMTRDRPCVGKDASVGSRSYWRRKDL